MIIVIPKPNFLRNPNNRSREKPSVLPFLICDIFGWSTPSISAAWA